jgi:Rer1 family
MMSSTDPLTPGHGSFGDPSPSSMPAALQPIATNYTRFTRQYQALLDRSAPHILQRWLTTSGLVSLFVLRIVFSQGVSIPFEQTNIMFETHKTLIYTELFSVVYRSV